MVRVTLYRNTDVIYRCTFSGHAGYSEHGSDIVCAAVSTLVLNTINSIEEFTKEEITIIALDNQKGIIDCQFSNRQAGAPDKDATLLLNAMVLGLKSIKQMYGEYITIHYNEKK